MDREEISRAIAAAHRGIANLRAEYPRYLEDGLVYAAQDVPVRIAKLYEEVRRLEYLLAVNPETPTHVESVAVEQVLEITSKRQEVLQVDDRSWWRRLLHL